MKILTTILILGWVIFPKTYLNADYWIFGIYKPNKKSIVIDSNYSCRVYDGEEKKCTLKDLSIILNRI